MPHFYHHPCRPPFHLALALAIGLSLAVGACGPEAPPDPASEVYQEATARFYTGVAAVQVGENGRAEQELRRVAELAPREPAAWANLAVLALQQGQLDEAAAHLATARELAPESPAVRVLSGWVERERGDLEAALGFVRAAADTAAANPTDTDLAALYLLAQTLEQRAAPGDLAEALRWVNRIAEARPDNLVARTEQARLAATLGTSGPLEAAAGYLAEQAAAWPEPIATTARELQQAVVDGDDLLAATQAVVLQNQLRRLPAYQEDQAVLPPSLQAERALITQFLWLPPPGPAVAPLDPGLAFTPRPLGGDGGPWPWARPFVLEDDAPPRIVVADGRTLRVGLGEATPTDLTFPGGPQARPPAPHGIAGLDYDYDFQVDLVAAGLGGLRLYRQEAGAFVDVTAEALPAAVARQPAVGAWTADLDMEGDVDLVLARPEGPPVVLRNNGDGTFSEETLFGNVSSLRGFAWADLDADGDPDAVLLGAGGGLTVLANQRRTTPRFRPLPTPADLGPALAMDVIDANADGTLDLLVLRGDGSVHSLAATADGWAAMPLIQDATLADTDAGSASLFAADLDNNGGFDLVASTAAGTRVWLRAEDGTYQPIETTLGAPVLGLADVEDQGRLDIFAVGPAGEAAQWLNQGTLNYHSVRLQPRAARAAGDRRINPFGLGGEVELRAGLLFQKQPITDAVVHFGLGPRLSADVARVLWPNGTVQAVFDLQSTQTILTEQRLKGSCPWVFTHDGERMRFATDFLWRTALGLRINAQGPPQVIHSIDWVNIDGDALAPRDGAYDVRITADLWETHFFDHVALLVVDHPDSTRVFANERFAFPPPPQRLYATGPLRPIASAYDDQGQDVTDLVAQADDRHLDTFTLGPYQGLAEDHYVEVDLGADGAGSEPAWLVASGWVYPTDSSINLAIGQGQQAPPRGLSLEVPDGTGGWLVVRDDLGFPAGKEKTILVDLRDVFRPGTPRRLRLRTSMEIYWDHLAWAEDASAAPVDTLRVLPAVAELRFRGFSATRKPARSVPERPLYDSLATTAPLWRDLEGYHTRFGDVRPLTAAIDDRYVIMNAGDELRFRFPAPPPPPDGWRRHFILIGDGWVKDGDYNTGASTTVRPLPYHGLVDYDVPTGPLEEDPAYQRHPDDWRTYHTRYVTPRQFQRALVPGMHP